MAEIGKLRNGTPQPDTSSSAIDEENLHLARLVGSRLRKIKNADTIKNMKMTLCEVLYEK